MVHKVLLYMNVGPSIHSDMVADTRGRMLHRRNRVGVRNHHRGRLVDLGCRTPGAELLGYCCSWEEVDD